MRAAIATTRPVRGLSPEAVRFTLRRAAATLFAAGLPPQEVMDLVAVKPLGEEVTKLLEALRTR